MREYEIVKIVNKIFKNKIILVLFCLIPFAVGAFDYSLLHVTTISFGIIFIFISLFMLYTNNKMSNNWTEIFGEVVDIKWHNRTLNDGHTEAYGQEVISYKTKN